jgi:hypothetical protein
MEQVPAELNLSAASRNVEESVLKSVADLRPAVMNTATGVKPVQRTRIHLSSRAVNESLPVLRPIIMLNQRTFGTNSCIIEIVAQMSLYRGRPSVRSCMCMAVRGRVYPMQPFSRVWRTFDDARQSFLYWGRSLHMRRS